jgi:hypothetical protein
MKAAPVLIALLATTLLAGGASARMVWQCADPGVGTFACVDAGSYDAGAGSCAGSTAYHQETNEAELYVGRDDGTFHAASVRTLCDATLVDGQPYQYHDVLVSADHQDPNGEYGQTAVTWGASDYAGSHWCDMGVDVEDHYESLGCPAGDPPTVGALLP